MAPKLSKPKMNAPESPMKIVRKMSSAMKVRPLKYASDFAGLGTWGTGLQKIAKLVPSVYNPLHVFSCDSLPASEKYINHADPPKHWFTDVVTRTMPTTNQDFHNVDVYTWSSPCQPFSPAGLRNGALDERTQVAKSSVDFIKKFKPKVFIMENVPQLATDRKYKAYWDWIQEQCREAGYVCNHTMINSSVYVPQNRRRLYFLGIRSDQLRKNTKGMPLFPISPPGRILEIHQIVTKLPDKDWCTTPDKTKANGLHYRNVVSAYKKLDKSINPFTTHVVIDFQASESFTTHRVGESPALTFTRSNQFGYWDSVKGGPLNVAEFAALQGLFAEDFPWRAAGISKTQAAGMLGNGQTLPVAMDILAHAMFHGNMITFDKFIAIKDAMYNEWDL